MGEFFREVCRFIDDLKQRHSKTPSPAASVASHLLGLSLCKLPQSRANLSFLRARLGLQETGGITVDIWRKGLEGYGT